MVQMEQDITAQSRWFDCGVFQDWFELMMQPILKRQDGVKVLISDNLSSHINHHVLKLCEDNNINFIALPPNSSHLLQPLDVSVFCPVKNEWRKVLCEWKESTRASHCTKILKQEFPALLKRLMNGLKDGIQNNLTAGFRKTGIYPLDRNAVLQHLPTAVLSNDSSSVSEIVGETFIKHLTKNNKMIPN